MADLYDADFEADNDPPFSPAEFEDLPDIPAKRESVVLAPQPLFQTLFAESIRSDDPVLQDFARHVVGPLSDHFALVTAKGGAFFEQKQAEGAPNTERYARDQTLRAHLINGMLPALHLARQLADWGSDELRNWDETTERLFIAGYMLHDYTKIPAVKQSLIAAGCKEMEAPGPRQIPTLRQLFQAWCGHLGLDPFLAPVGGSEALIDDLLYVATNTQRLTGTIHAAHLLSPALDVDIYQLATEISHLADLMAYIAPTPRDMVANPTLHKAVLSLSLNRDGKSVGRLIYHHVAENRGLLLNFIHNAVLRALQDEAARIPVLYAPSGVVYLERDNAPSLPPVEVIIEQVISDIRQQAGQRTTERKAGYSVSKDGYRVNETYNDLFDLREFIRISPRLAATIRGNPTQYLDYIQTSGWPGGDMLPLYSADPKDSRLRQMAEWTSQIEIQFEERMPALVDAFAACVLEAWRLEDLATTFAAMRPFKQMGTGVRHRWYWLAGHALNRSAGIDPNGVLEWLAITAEKVIAIIPETLPSDAQVNPVIWDELADYIASILTVSGIKAETVAKPDEFTRYVRSKGKGAGTLCSICGSAYTTREQLSSAVAFQPGVYTGRIKLSYRDNKRNLCSICALEQLLRQLFVDNLDSGGSVEGQRVRYLAFYPSYFFTPETLRFIKRAYTRLSEVRISDKELRRALLDQEDLTDAKFWQRLEAFLIRPVDAPPSKRILRYHEDAQATFFMVGFRNFNDPTETESWVLPAFLALVLAVCLDVKVVASDSGIPLMLESGEMRETLWFDGIHPAIQALIGKDHLRIDDLAGESTVPLALARLTAAYLIHLDTEYEPPKEQWHRLGPIATALMESPLYVFHYLKKQERDDRHVGPDQIARYVRYAETLFNPHGDPLMSHAKELVNLYRQFYRARTITNANSILRPLSVVADALLAADMRLFNDPESLVELAYGELYRFMDRVGKGLADGRFPGGVTAPEREMAMRQFCQKFVQDVFIDVFKGDVAALRGKQLNLLRSACEVLYRDAQRLEWAARGRDADEVDETDTEA